MGKQLSLLLLVLAMLVGMSGCGKSADSQSEPQGSTWQEQYDLGVRYLSEGNYEEAIIAFTAAIEIDPKRAPAYIGRGDAYVLSSETEENLAAAWADYEQAIELDETSAGAYLGLADVYIRQGDHDKALDILKQGIKAVGENREISDKIQELENTTEQEVVEEYGFQIQVTSDGVDVDAEDLTVHVADNRSGTITVSGISLRDSYLTNLSTSTQNALEYGWSVEMYGEQNAYSVSTSTWAFSPGEEETISLEEMQHSVWHKGEDSWPLIADAEMSHTLDSITWTFTVPEEYPFDFEKVDRYEVMIFDVFQGLNLQRIYTLN